MGDYRRIFLIVDPSRRKTPAFWRAVHLARATGAALHLGLYEHPAARPLALVSPQLAEQARRAFLEERQRWLDGVARTLCDEGVTATSEVELRTPAHDAIAERVLELSPDLVLKDVHHEPALSRILFTSLDWQLLRFCPAPLLMVSGRAESWPRRVLAAVDTLDVSAAEAELNDRIVAEALRLALQCNAEVHLLHAFSAVPPPTAGMIEGIDGLSVAYDQLASLDSDRFDDFARRHGVPPERKHLLAGSADQAIVEFAADATADLVVIGTSYRTGLDRLLLGATAERLLGQVRCDVLAVQPEGFRADVARHLGLKPAAARQAA